MTKNKAPIVIAAAVALVVSALTLINPLQVIQWKLTDLFFLEGASTDEITIIGIDDKSVDPATGLGRFQDWPRSYYADLLDVLKKYNPKVIGFDLLFQSPSQGIGAGRLQELIKESGSIGAVSLETLRAYASPSTRLTHPDDLVLQKTLREQKQVVLLSTLATTEDPNKGYAALNNGAQEIPLIFSGNGITSGFGNVFPDADGILRRFLPRRGSHDFFSIAIAKLAGTETLPIEEKTMRIVYTAAPFSYRVVSFVDALRGQLPREAIENRTVLIGPYRAASQDLRETPMSSQPMFGVEIHANIIQQLLEGKRLTELPLIVTLLLILAFAVFGTALFFKFDPKILLIVFFAVLIGYPLAAFALHQVGISLNIVYPTIAWIGACGTTLWHRNKTEFREKREIKNAFQHYVSPVVVEELLKDPTQLKLGGKRQPITIMFSDIVGFTSISEKLSPEDTVALLNSYLDAMSEVIFSYNGTLDKFQGDAIMAIFGSPLPDPHHPEHACYTALGMRKVLATLHQRWGQAVNISQKDILTGLDFRVGIATGDAVIGNIGSHKRFDYTAIGDIVNLGSRLESINRQYGTQVIVNKNTFSQITGNRNPFIFRKLDMVRVKGKRESTEIFELVALREQMKEELKTMLDDFENGRILYTQRNFKEAKQHFESGLNRYPNDGPCTIYLNRCVYFMRNPPPRTWDAVVNMEEK